MNEPPDDAESDPIATQTRVPPDEPVDETEDVVEETDPRPIPTRTRVP